VFFAIRDAVASLGDYRINPRSTAPATGESIMKALDAVRAAMLGKNK
jgi:xanthine dehydrogenase large subunit